MQLLKKEIRAQVFSWSIAKFLIPFILKNICERLLFDIFNGSPLHGPKGSRSRLYDGVRLQGLSHRSSFLFLSWHKPSSSPGPTFENLRPIKFLYWLFLVILDGFTSFLDRFKSF